MIGLALEIARHTGTAIAQLARSWNGNAVTPEHTSNGLAHHLVFDAALSEPNAERLILGDARRWRRRQMIASTVPAAIPRRLAAAAIKPAGPQ